ncbi:MAG: hypothetical protein ABFE07_21205 [Armatimonadia bacterium]
MLTTALIVLAVLCLMAFLFSFFELDRPIARFTSGVASLDGETMAFYAAIILALAALGSLAF